MLDYQSNIEFQSGCAAWNRGDPFAAHEHWENLWRAEKGVARLFLQGLIQLAAARVKADRNLAKGYASLSQKGFVKVKQVNRELPIEWQRWIAAIVEVVDVANSAGKLPDAWPDVPQSLK